MYNIVQKNTKALCIYVMQFRLYNFLYKKRVKYKRR